MCPDFRDPHFRQAGRPSRARALSACGRRPLDAGGSAYVVGCTKSDDFPTTPGAVQAATGGLVDGFLLKVGPQNPETIGVWDPGDVRFTLRNVNTSASGSNSFQFGLPTDIPICGDWDGDGRDGIGVFTAAGQFRLDNNFDGVIDVKAFAFGLPTDLPLAGDWDGDGDDTVGIFRDGSFQLLLNNLGAAAPDILANFGGAGDLPVVGDWDGDAVTTLGVFTAGAFGQRLFALRNSNTTGPAELSFAFGAAGDFPLAGDWNGRP